VWTLLLAPLLGLPLPLQPLQILWINLITDGLPGLALTAEPPEHDLMRRPPRPPRESLFAGGLGAHVLIIGVLMAAVTLAVQAWAIHVGDSHWQSMTFTTLTLVQMGQVLAVRSEHRSLLQLGLGSNRPLLAAVALTILLQFAVIYLPPVSRLFHTAPLTLAELGICLACALLPGAAVEAEKQWRRPASGLP
ncbi:MAG: cation transporting ATPase C-terminal domain-containing protein, partial [Terriglobales bacterium]